MGGGIPIATYRLQFGRHFTFDDAAALIPYLHELGVTHCYASPFLRARGGSPHGYDIVDHNALNPEIGNAGSFDRLIDALRRYRMGLIMDLVPNHMGVGGDDNAWWLDVLENGPASAYEPFFDIDWFSVKEELRGKVLVPVLGGHYGTVLENGELRLSFERARGEFSVWYYNHRFPLEPRTYPRILERGIDLLIERLGADDPMLAEYRTLVTAFGHLPSRWETTAAKLEERRRDKEVHKRRLMELCGRCPAIHGFIENNVALFNGQPGEPASFDTLHDLLEEQVYRMAYWQVASDEINYRRFFDINDLAGLRMEEHPVFDTTHRFVLQLVREGKLHGLRIDHPDGLYDPPAYYERLRREIKAALGGRDEEFYLIVEKILASYEKLVESWPVHGTTGYDFANSLNGLFVNGEAEHELDRTYARFTGRALDFDEVLYQSKRLTIEVQLSSELTVLASMLDDIAQRNRHTRDFTLNGCRNAITSFVANFPIYRTYIAENRVTDDDRRYVEWAVAQAKKRNPAADVSLLDFIRSILLDEVRHDDPLRRARAARFAMKLQQYTAPVMAKALEDTAFYRYHRLVSLNEVGGDPRRVATTVAAFHHANQERMKNWPHGMLATSTHDTKRSEDVRARINVISEMADEWRTHLSRWRRFARSKKLFVDGGSAPTRNDEYLFYQTLIGAWPTEAMDERRLDEFRERIKRYMLKAVKEAKVSSSWINPNAAYEEAVCHFVEEMLSHSGQNAFLADFVPFQRRLSRYGLLNSLSQQVLKLTVPGVPDIYQGTELWEFSLVDPDNRRAVDYRTRRALLRRLADEARRRSAAEMAGELLDRPEDGRVKLYVTWKLLNLRQRFPDLFHHGDYLPLPAAGARANHLVAFERRCEGHRIIVLAGRYFAVLFNNGEPRFPCPGSWTDTVVEAPVAGRGRFRELLTDSVVAGERRGGLLSLPVAPLLGRFPAAVLVGE